MEPIIYQDNFTEGNKIDILINEIKWVDEQFARLECFMSDFNVDYQYIENGPRISLTFRKINK